MEQKNLNAYDVMYYDEHSDLCVETYWAGSEAEARIKFCDKHGSKLDIWDVHPIEL